MSWKASVPKVFGAGCLGFASFAVCNRIGMPLWEAIVVTACIVVAVVLLVGAPLEDVRDKLREGEDRPS